MILFLYLSLLINPSEPRWPIQFEPIFQQLQQKIDHYALHHNPDLLIESLPGNITVFTPSQIDPAEPRFRRLYPILKKIPKKDYIPEDFFKKLHSQKKLLRSEVLNYIIQLYRHNPEYNQRALLELILIYNSFNRHSIKDLWSWINRSPAYTGQTINLDPLIDILNHLSNIKQLYFWGYLKLSAPHLKLFLKGVNGKHINHIERFQGLIDTAHYNEIGKIIFFIDRYNRDQKSYRNLTLSWSEKKLPDYVTVLDMLLHFNPQGDNLFKEEIALLRKYGAKTYKELQKEREK